mmetsp:Transcript_18741/g.37119  ORF Transcript_18741/g.37119 Transcript_18741/m.37119 type:complete len:234 (+) Transcript_18741:195-896(+)
MVAVRPQRRSAAAPSVAPPARHHARRRGALEPKHPKTPFTRQLQHGRVRVLAARVPPLAPSRGVLLRFDATFSRRTLCQRVGRSFDVRGRSGLRRCSSEEKGFEVLHEGGALFKQRRGVRVLLRWVLESSSRENGPSESRRGDCGDVMEHILCFPLPLHPARVVGVLSGGALGGSLSGAECASVVRALNSSRPLVLSLTKRLNHTRTPTVVSKTVLRNAMRGRSNEYHFPKLL